MAVTVTDRLFGENSSVAIKAPVRTTTSGANIVLSGLQTVGGVALASGDRVLVKDQTDTTQNGIYNASTAAWTRAGDFDGANDVVQGTLVIAYLGNGQGLLFQLSSPNPVTIGSSPITFTPYTNPNQTYPQSLAEAANGIVPTNLAYPWGHAWRYGADPNGVIESTVALNNSLRQSYHALGTSPYWPQGTYLISNLIVTGTTRVRTDGYSTILQQKPGLFQLIVVDHQNAADAIWEPITVQGRIDVDSADEFHHAFGIESGCKHVTIMGLRGVNISGDVLNVAGTAAGNTVVVNVDEVDGQNVLRSLVAITGGLAINLRSIGPGNGVGYRTIDVEPNPLSETPTSLRIENIVGANIQVAGGNLAGGIGAVEIGSVDLDNNRLANSVPGYFSYPGSAGNVGLVTGDFDGLQIGHLKARNFQERLFIATANTKTCKAFISNYDIAECDSGESTVNALIYVDANCTVQLGTDGGGGGTIVLAAANKTIFNSSSTSKYILKNAKVSGGLIAANGVDCLFENCTVDATGVNGNLYVAVTKSEFRRMVHTNDGAATLQNLCGNNTWINCSAAPATLNAAPTAAHIYLECTFNAIAYRLNSLEVAAAWNPGTINAAAIAFTDVAVTGAVMGDLAIASFQNAPANRNLVKFDAEVTANGNVRVWGTNRGGSAVNFANDTVRVAVFKAT